MRERLAARRPAEQLRQQQKRQLGSPPATAAAPHADRPPSRLPSLRSLSTAGFCSGRRAPAMAVLALALAGLAIFGFILFVVLWLMHFMSIIYT